MRIGIGGAGSVGCAIAHELIKNNHRVLLIEKNEQKYRPDLVPQAQWFLADACEISSLEQCHIGLCDVVIAATGDDKTNLVMGLLMKIQFHVPRVAARVNDACNEYLFTSQWGIDIVLSAPHAVLSTVQDVLD